MGKICSKLGEKENADNADPVGQPFFPPSCMPTMRRNAVHVSGTLRAKKPASAKPTFELQKDLKKSPKVVDCLRKALCATAFCSEMVLEHVHKVVAKMHRVQLKKGETLYTEGDESNECYILLSGELRVSKQGDFPVVMQQGIFGVTSLLYNSTRTHTVECLKESVLWTLSREDFQKEMSGIPCQPTSSRDESVDIMEAISACYPFSTLDKNAVIALTAIATVKRFKSNEPLILQGQKCEHVSIIQSGWLSSSRHTRMETSIQLPPISEGCVLGHECLLSSGSISLQEYIAASPVVVVAIPFQRASSILQPLTKHFLRLYAHWTMRAIPVFGQCDELEALAGEATCRFLNDGDVLHSPEELMIPLSIIVCGEVKFLMQPERHGRRANTSVDDTVVPAPIPNQPDATRKRALTNSSGGSWWMDQTQIPAPVPPLGHKPSRPSPLRHEAPPPPEEPSAFHAISRPPSNKTPGLRLLKILQREPPGTMERCHSVPPSSKKDKREKRREQHSRNRLEIGRMVAGEHFGEASLLTGRPARYSAVAVGSTWIFEIAYASFHKIASRALQHSLGILLAKKVASDVAPSRSIELSDLTRLHLLGKGSYGIVSLVRHTLSGRVFALKQLSREKILKMHETLHVQNEIDVLASIDHPFVAAFVRHYETATQYCILTQAVLGGEFYYFLKERLFLSWEEAKFYTAQLIDVLGHLHERCVVYRDLKPENLLIDDQGYLKMVDFGLSKRLARGNPPEGVNPYDLKSLRTFTFCGTPMYIPPEVYKLSGHGLSTDWWALGIFVHEMLVGRPPFDSLSPVKVMERLTQYSRVYPSVRLSSKLSPALTTFILSLLNPNPARRLGSRNGADELRQTDVFSDFPWPALLRKELEAPYIPRVDTPYDVRHFEHIDDDVGEGVPGELSHAAMTRLKEQSRMQASSPIITPRALPLAPYF